MPDFDTLEEAKAYLAVQQGQQQRQLQFMANNPSSVGTMEGLSLPPEVSRGIEKGEGLTLSLSGLLPHTIPAIAAPIGKALRGLFGTPPTKEMQIERAMKSLGFPATTGERTMQASAAKPLFQAAEQAGPVPAKNILDSLEKNVIPESNAATRSKATKFLHNLLEKYGEMDEIPHSDLLKETQRLRKNAEDLLRSAHPDSNAAKALYQTRADMLDAMDAVSPSAKRANQIVRRDEVGKQLVESFRENRVHQLFENDPSVAKGLGLPDAESVNRLTAVADKIAATPLSPQNKALNLLKWASAVGIGATIYGLGHRLVFGSGSESSGGGGGG